MNTRCKFKCNFVTKFDNDSYAVELVPVIGGSEENDKFFKWTPGGKFELRLLKPETAEMFIPGKTYYIDISESESE